MKIVIIGAGAVGTAICLQLVKEDHAITVIDSSSDTVTEISNIADVTGILGNGADISVLKEANAEEADIVIAVTESDELNILSCYAATKLGAKNTIARVRNPEYNEFLELAGEDMKLSLTINPEYEVAKQIAAILSFPSASRLDTFLGGKVDLAELCVQKGSPLSDLSLIDIRKKFSSKVLVCCVYRNGKGHIPSGNFVIKEGDILSITASATELELFFKEAGSYMPAAREILITGAGRVTYYLSELIRDKHLNVVAIEKDHSKARALAEDFPSFSVICDDGTNQELLIEEGIDNADAFLALSGVDEENAIVSMFAKTMKVPTIVTLISSLPYVDFFRGVGIESIVSPKHATVGQILRFVRSLAASGARDSEIEALYRVMDGDIEALEFAVKESIEGITDIPLKDINKKSNTIIACIVHGDEIIIPGGKDVISKGDTVIVFTQSEKMKSIKDII